MEGLEKPVRIRAEGGWGGGWGKSYKGPGERRRGMCSEHPNHRALSPGGLRQGRAQLLYWMTWLNPKHVGSITLYDVLIPWQ